MSETNHVQSGSSKRLMNILGFSVGIVALTLGYYFGYARPQLERDKFEFQKNQELQKQDIDASKRAEEEVSRAISISEEVKASCLTRAKDISYSFNEDNAKSSPIFYPYKNLSSMEKNERLVLALTVYSGCLRDDPRREGNSYLFAANIDAVLAQNAIQDWMENAVKEDPSLCKDVRASASFESWCADLKKGVYK